MRKILLGCAAVVAGLIFGWGLSRAENWLKAEYKSGDFHEFYSPAGPKVALYGTSWCPACKSTRETLNSMGVEFSDFDIEQSADANKKYLSLGESVIPIVFVQDRMIVGFNREAVLAAVQNYREQSEP